MHLILEGQLLAQTLVLILQIDTCQGLSLELLAQIIQLTTQTFVLRAQILHLILGLLAIGQSLTVLSIHFGITRFIEARIVLCDGGLFGFLLESIWKIGGNGKCKWNVTRDCTAPYQ